MGRFRGTHTGEFFGIPPTGKSVTFSGMHLMRIADGKIAEHWGNNDDLGLMRQLGVVPAPDEAASAAREPTPSRGAGGHPPSNLTGSSGAPSVVA